MPGSPLVNALGSVISWPVLLALFLLRPFACSAQENALSFVNIDDSLKEWGCPLPVEATIHTKDKRKITYAIIAADDHGFLVLNTVPDSVQQHSIEWQRTFWERMRQRDLIESDKSLSLEEQRKKVLDGWIGVLYRDTLLVPIAEIKKVVFHYSDASRLQRTIPLAAYIAAGCVFMVGMIELIHSSDPEIESMPAPTPAILLVAGLGGLAASGSWMFHTYHQVIRPGDWRLQR